MTSIASALNLRSIWLILRANHDPGSGVDKVSVQEADRRPTMPSSVQSVVFNYSCYCGVRIELA